ncbi:MAG: hypothetical protein H6754_04215 [Candidatus Omnitrophica bacterium]|nr:hypothetical protein [Candidatus Omnitrophota bacterium]
MKRLFLIFAILTQMTLPMLCEAAGSYTGSFNLSVTIPAVIGLNVPDPTLKVQGDLKPVSTEQMIYSNTATQYTEIAMVRNHQNITLRTLVVR